MLIADIQLFGVRLQEPGTIVSDLLMGLACIVFFFKLVSQKEDKQQKHLTFFFLFLGFSSFLAAFAHGLFSYFGIYLHIVSWFFSGLSLYYLQLGTTKLLTNPKFKVAYSIFIKTQFLAYLILIFTVSSFEIVKFNFVISLIGIITPIYLVDYFRNKFRFNFYIIGGVFIAILPSLYHKVNFNFGYIFNMNDLSHFVLILCIFFLFIGLRERFFSFDDIFQEDTNSDVVDSSESS